MPDLDLIKQGEQGVRDRRGRFARGPVGQSRWPAAGRGDHVKRAARLLLAEEGEALTQSRRIGARRRPESARPLGGVYASKVHPTPGSTGPFRRL
jgi:hypothetical protein